jgi:hypothetical protein
VGEQEPQRQPESTFPGLNQNPVGSSWHDAPQSEPRGRLWPLAVGTVALIAVVAGIILFLPR